MKIIVGLGNPGRKYEGTRHNVGFDVATSVAQRLGGTSVRNRFEAEVCEIHDGGDKALIMLPQTYMNLSGRSVAAAVNFYKLSPDQIIVISDDLNLPIGGLRLRAKGSAGGQKGLADIIRHLGTEAFPRIRVGIDRPPPGYAVTDYVLGRFTDEQNELLQPVLGKAADATLLWLKSGIAEAMNRYNASPAAKPSRPRRSGGSAGASVKDAAAPAKTNSNTDSLDDAPGR